MNSFKKQLNLESLQLVNEYNKLLDLTPRVLQRQQICTATFCFYPPPFDIGTLSNFACWYYYYYYYCATAKKSFITLYLTKLSLPLPTKELWRSYWNVRRPFQPGILKSLRISVQESQCKVLLLAPVRVEKIFLFLHNFILNLLWSFIIIKLMNFI